MYKVMKNESDLDDWIKLVQMKQVSYIVKLPSKTTLKEC